MAGRKALVSMLELMKTHLEAAAALVVMSVASAFLIAIAPAVASFAGAVSIAIAWCIWLEAHPDRI